MFKSFSFWISFVGFTCVYIFANALSLSDYLGVLAGCLIIGWSDLLGQILGDK